LAATAGATWDPATKTANVSLSGGNLVATSTAASRQDVRGTAGHASGKYYAEFTLTTLAGTNTGIGVVNNSFPIDGSTYPGADTNSSGCFNNGNIIFNNVVQFSNPSFGQGIIVGMAVDAGLSKVWYQLSAGWGSGWNNNVGEDPATNGGGVVITGGGTFFPALDMESTDNGDVWTANFAGPYTLTVPSGFGNW
jgi:hypothetical protein